MGTGVSNMVIPLNSVTVVKHIQDPCYHLVAKMAADLLNKNNQETAFIPGRSLKILFTNKFSKHYYLYKSKF
jgi:hypothetical protein